MSTVNREMYKKANVMLSYKADRSKKREVVTDERISSQKQQKKMNQNGYGLPSQSKTPQKKKLYSFMPNMPWTRKLWRILRSSIISSLPPGIA